MMTDELVALARGMLDTLGKEDDTYFRRTGAYVTKTTARDCKVPAFKNTQRRLDDFKELWK